MPSYTIEYAGGFDSDGYESLLAAIRLIIERWEDNEINCDGIIAFLNAHDRDFDDLYYTEKSHRLTIGEAALEICTHGGEEVQKDFIAALTHIAVFET